MIKQTDSPKFLGIPVVAKFIREKQQRCNRGRFEWKLKQLK
jgi:hypothetical protein